MVSLLIVFVFHCSHCSNFAPTIAALINMMSFIGTFDGNFKGWNFGISTKENVLKKGNGWGYMPGITPMPDVNLSDLLSKVPDKNREKVVKAIDFVFRACSKFSSDSAVIPEEWKTAYDMRPWCAFPERR